MNNIQVLRKDEDFLLDAIVALNVVNSQEAMQEIAEQAPESFTISTYAGKLVVGKQQGWLIAEDVTLSDLSAIRNAHIAAHKAQGHDASWLEDALTKRPMFEVNA